MIEKAKVDKIIKWGIIGCGDVTEVKSGPAYQQVAGFELSAVMRRDLEKAKDYAQRHGVPKYSNDADQLINDPEIDAVYIATPPDTHKYYALKVAAAGKPCCIEKPMAPNHQECQNIVKVFEEKKLPLFVAYYRRTLPRFTQVKTWIDEGKIGEVRHIRWHYSKEPSEVDLSKSPNWRTDPLVAPGGYFDDLASHGLDLFVHLLGEIKQVAGMSLNQQGLYGAMDAFTASWLHVGGVTGSGSWNFGCASQEDRVEIYGSLGKIEFSIFDDQPLVCRHKQGDEILNVPHPSSVQLHHVERMRDELFGGKAHPSTGLSGAHTSWVMDQILNLSKLGGMPKAK
ncbi:Gfo/Idh/MocA family oxidoreductase [Reichenbachiella agarivorans]|uniref:Gfo/Idh/MocA family oxidoreductase n=1 Tax=Reichenbachiella agarivorans TaxID=2979464 RepID=A0ABY6CP67_9BACT|nr:Gfo/Idh/MocA family oxidoreductase [Reichenbachiella agarivorans]UXP31825.1 Gfo/Idh/MocA family oxidoreductase [Reichenbachiella agarivorans]